MYVLTQFKMVAVHKSDVPYVYVLTQFKMVAVHKSDVPYVYVLTQFKMVAVHEAACIYSPSSKEWRRTDAMYPIYSPNLKVKVQP